MERQKELAMHIRPARPDDAKVCYELFLADAEEYWSPDDFRRSTEDSHVIFLVAEEADDIVGYILGFFVPTRKSEVGLHETRVHRDSRGKGIGTTLVAEFCRQAFTRGAKIVSASIEPELMKFYGDACGFQKSGEWIEVDMKQ